MPPGAPAPPQSVSQDSAPAGSSRTARSPSLSDSLRDSAADRSLASPPSVADAVAEDEAAALSREAPGAGCNDEKEDMARATACWSDFDLVIAVEEPMDEGFDWPSQSTTATVLSST